MMDAAVIPLAYQPPMYPLPGELVGIVITSEV